MTSQGNAEAVKADPPRGVEWEHLSAAELDFQLSPSKSAKDAAGTLERHIGETAALQADAGVRSFLNIPYGERPRACFDLYRPTKLDLKTPCVAFVHGGFWQEGSTAGAGFAAAALAERGWGLAAVGYTLTPTVRLRDIVAEIADAVVMLRNRLGVLGLDPNRLVLAGHSAGAHLVAAIVAGMGGDEAAQAIASAVLISGVYDLAPIAASYVNKAARIDDDEVADLSPLFAPPTCDVPVQILIGADEPDAFQAQSTALYQAWSPTLTDITIERITGRDHFDVLDELARHVR